MGYNRRRYQQPKGSQVFALNITSMTDMFTILLVFLLQTYSTTEIQLEPDPKIALPVSSSQASPKKALQVSVSSSELKVNNETVASLSDSGIQSQDVEASDSQFIKPLFQSLQGLTKEQETGEMILVADQNVPYSTLRKVMYTATMAGFPHVKIATLSGQ